MLRSPERADPQTALVTVVPLQPPSFLPAEVPSSRRALVVASTAADHAHVRHSLPDDGERTTPGAPGPVRVAQRPARPDPGWAAVADFDVLHLHAGAGGTDGTAGTGALQPDELDELVQVLRTRGKPLVVTVRHLRHPHHDRADELDRQLDVLVPAADELVTLTPGAAAAIETRWGRRARVVPHPHVVPLARMAARGEIRSRRPADEIRIGLHLRSLRPSMDPMAILPTLVETVARLRGAVLQVNGHRDALEPGGRRVDPRLACYLRKSAERGLVDLRVHDPLSEAGLWDHLEELDASVLPDRFGTHSGWLEACRDLGTTVIAPTCGFHAEQGPVLSYVHDETRFVPETLADAVRRVYDERPDLSCSVRERREQRAQVADLHERLYGDLVGDRSG